MHKNLLALTTWTSVALSAIAIAAEERLWISRKGEDTGPPPSPGRSWLGGGEAKKAISCQQFGSQTTLQNRSFWQESVHTDICGGSELEMTFGGSPLNFEFHPRQDKRVETVHKLMHASRWKRTGCAGKLRT